MKYLLFLLIAISLIDCKTPSKTVAPSSESSVVKHTVDDVGLDTTGYLIANFLKKKSIYVGQPLSKLFDSLILPIKAYTIGRTSENKKISPTTMFTFGSEAETIKSIESASKPYIITVTWEKPLPMDAVYRIFSESHGEWKQQDKDYYLSQLIQDFYISKGKIIKVKE